MTFKLYLTAFFLMLSCNVVAQNSDTFLFKGELRNSKNESVPYASVFVKNRQVGVAANESGKFEFLIQKSFASDSIEINALGYKTYTDRISNLFERLHHTIYLSDTVYLLQEIEITILSPEEIINKTLQQWENNFPLSGYQFESFYRTTQKENGRYAKLLEASVNGFDRNYQSDKKKDVILQIDNIRYSNDYRDPRTHWLVSFFKPEFIYTTENFSRNKKAIERDIEASNYIFEQDSVVLFNDQPVYVISAIAKETVGKFIFDITFYIRTDNYAIVRMDFDAKRKLGYLKPSGIPGALSLGVTGYKATCVFQEFNDRMFMHYINLYASFTWTDPRSGQTLNQEESSEAIVQNIVVVNKRDTHIGQSRKVDYYGPSSFHIPFLSYSPQFWKNYEMQQQIPYAPGMIVDLEKEMILEEQFKKNGKH